ncbi:hypothetical protein LX36DRAFT_333905 [Colletotrichum falcatum]|nr:hypothetical protein LX36DRAFT_333905 [Colletotrichum falcatum]
MDSQAIVSRGGGRRGAGCSRISDRTALGRGGRLPACSSASAASTPGAVSHNIVIASLFVGVYGFTLAATTALGIGGGIPQPDEDRDIHLGDVVISQPDGTTGGVCQYDLVKLKPGNIRERKGFLGMPPTGLLKALASMQADHEIEDSKVPEFLQSMLQINPKMAKKPKQNPGYVHQGFDNSDGLCDASYEHVSGQDCHGCEAANEVDREPRDTMDPESHYGIIASGDTFVKDAAASDQIVEDVGEDCICFEMEAAGPTYHFPCLVIRGIWTLTRMIDGSAMLQPLPLPTKKSFLRMCRLQRSGDPRERWKLSNLGQFHT